jgi:hypothetical protein
MFDNPSSEAYPSETPNGLAPAFPTNIGLRRSTLAYDAAVLFSSVKAQVQATGDWTVQNCAQLNRCWSHVLPYPIFLLTKPLRPAWLLGPTRLALTLTVLTNLHHKVRRCNTTISVTVVSGERSQFWQQNADCNSCR